MRLTIETMASTQYSKSLEEIRFEKQFEIYDLMPKF